MTRYASKTTGLDTWNRAWEVSPKRPYSKPLPFTSNWRKETQFPNSRYPGLQTNDDAYVAANNYKPDLTAMSGRARDLWVEKAKGEVSADLGLTLATWKSSLSMASNAFRSLASKANRAELYYRRKASNLYLEGIFGWVPLMQDVYNAYEVLSDLSPSAKLCKVRISDSQNGNVSGPAMRGALHCSAGVQVGGSIRCVNPNLALLERLGLVNPAAIAWDAVPYSFVINWFVPVGGFLKSLSDMVGWEQKNTWTTTFVRKEFAGSVLTYNRESQREEWGTRVVRLGAVNRGSGIPPRSLPSLRLPGADLYKATVSFALLDQKLREPLKRAWRYRNRYTE